MRLVFVEILDSCAQGRVFTFGSGAFGQLGHSSTARVSEPKAVEQLVRLVSRDDVLHALLG